MAHGSEKRTQLRGFYVYQRLPMELAAEKVGIPRSTANRWKQEAEKAGDDWDTARAAVAMGDENFVALSKQLLEDYLLQHQATMEQLRNDKKISHMERAKTLASMSDSLNKTMNSIKRVSPELNKQAVALDVLHRLAEFAKRRYPKHVTALVELLEPFGAELAKG
jgi:hypothetical protein